MKQSVFIPIILYSILLISNVFSQECLLTDICGTCEEHKQGLAKTNQSQSFNGAFLPTEGNVRALWIICKFSDDNFDWSPYTDSWPSSLSNVNNFPGWTTRVLKPSTNIPNNDTSLSGWYNVMSFGKLKMFGEVFKYVPLFPQSYYYLNNGRGLGFLNEEVIREVDDLYDLESDNKLWK